MANALRSVVCPATSGFYRPATGLIGSGSWTYAVWVYNYDLTSFGPIIGAGRYVDNTHAERHFALGLNGNKYSLFYTADPTNTGTWGSTSIVDTTNAAVNTWELIAWRFDGTNIQLIRNGVQVATATFAGFATPTSVAQVLLGVWDGLNAGNRAISSPRVYNAALNDAALLVMYNAGIGQTYAQVGKTNLLASWDFTAPNNLGADSTGTYPITAQPIAQTAPDAGNFPRQLFGPDADANHPTPEQTKVLGTWWCIPFDGANSGIKSAFMATGESSTAPFLTVNTTTDLNGALASNSAGLRDTYGWKAGDAKYYMASSKYNLPTDTPPYLGTGWGLYQSSNALTWAALSIASLDFTGLDTSAAVPGGSGSQYIVGTTNKTIISSPQIVQLPAGRIRVYLNIQPTGLIVTPGHENDAANTNLYSLSRLWYVDSVGAAPFTGGFGTPHPVTGTAFQLLGALDPKSFIDLEYLFDTVNGVHYIFCRSWTYANVAYDITLANPALNQYATGLFVAYSTTSPTSGYDNWFTVGPNYAASSPYLTPELEGWVVHEMPGGVWRFWGAGADNDAYYWFDTARPAKGQFLSPASFANVILNKVRLAGGANPSHTYFQPVGATGITISGASSGVVGTATQLSAQLTGGGDLPIGRFVWDIVSGTATVDQAGNVTASAAGAVVARATHMGNLGVTQTKSVSFSSGGGGTGQNNNLLLVM